MIEVDLGNKLRWALETCLKQFTSYNREENK